MASEVITNMLNPKNFFFSGLKFKLCAFITCGLSWVIKIFTSELFILKYAKVLNNLIFTNFIFINKNK